MNSLETGSGGVARHWVVPRQFPVFFVHPRCPCGMIAMGHDRGTPGAERQARLPRLATDPHMHQHSSAASAADKASMSAPSSAAPSAPPSGGRVRELMPYQDVLSVPPIDDLTGSGSVVRRTVRLVPADYSYAPTQLPATTAWSYNGTVPGPTFVAHRNQTVFVRWDNEIDERHPLPYRVLRFNDPDPGSNLIPQNAPGTDNGTLDPAGSALTEAASKLTAATVTHLHGGRVGSDSDGWTENVSTFRHVQHTVYHDRPRAAGLWYHDHAIGVNRLNVYAGLFGLWLIRDDVEQRLIEKGTLPGGKDEIGLVIQDRNLDRDEAGTLNGRILHKTETSTAEMFGSGRNSPSGPVLSACGCSTAQTPAPTA
jgi:hypothetical protein